MDYSFRVATERLSLPNKRAIGLGSSSQCDLGATQLTKSLGPNNDKPLRLHCINQSL